MDFQTFFFSFWCDFFVLLKLEAASLHRFHVSDNLKLIFEHSILFLFGLAAWLCCQKWPPLCFVCQPASLFLKPQDAHTGLSLFQPFLQKYKIGCLLQRCAGKQKMFFLLPGLFVREEIVLFVLTEKLKQLIYTDPIYTVSTDYESSDNALVEK